MGFNNSRATLGALVFSVGILLIPAGLAFAEATVQIDATNVMCNSVAALPQWGAGGHTITATTATDWVAQSDGNCQLEPDWQFQWATQSASNPGDNSTTPAGTPWNTFPTLTDSNGVTSVSVPASDNWIWVREVLQPGFIPFAGVVKTQPVDGSAAMFCNEDGINYDNYDSVTPLVAGQTYYCVAFNAPVLETPTTATLTIVKDTVGGDGTFTFDVASTTDDGGSESVQIATDGGVATSSTITLAPGTYNVTEEGQDGWNFDGSNCVYSDDSVGSEIENGEAIEVDAGDTVTCTFTNTTASSGGENADVGITKTVDNSTPNSGDMVTYTLTASDIGADATGVVVQDVLPSELTFVSTTSADTTGVYDPVSGDWTIGDLSSTTPVTLQIMATVKSGLDNGTQITNTANVTAGDTSGDTDNDSASATLTVTIPSDNGGGGGGGGGSNIPSIPGGGGGNGPISGSFGASFGQVLGASTTTVPTTPTTPISCTALLTTYMRIGKPNDTTQVMRLQQFLDNVGFNIPVTGFFGPMTESAVEKFQTEYATEILTPWNITSPTGFVYKTTLHEINLLSCPTLDAPFPTLP